ncbi:MAG: InlB B-repeat-containing protein [Clostridia bacterium]|nr:InlB B-repeat-containing protein [Clostridia bacterium]
MKSKQKKLLIRKLLIMIVLLFFLFSVFKVGKSLAAIDSFIITDAEIMSKSDTTDISNFSFEKCKIKKSVTYYQVGDSITYKVKIRNNDEKNYKIKSVNDDNKNEYISYLYDNYEGVMINSKDETSIKITERYENTINNISDCIQNFSVNIKFTLEDENGNIVEKTMPINTSSNPETGDNITLYISTSIISFVVLIILSKYKTLKLKSKNSYTIPKYKARHLGNHVGKGFKIFGFFIACIIVLPAISKAVADFAMVLTFENNIVLKNKLSFSYIIGDTEITENINYNEKITNLDNPEKEGYEFNGWKKEDGTEFNPETPITNDTKILAEFKPITYTIAYELNGGQVENENPKTYTIESEDIALNKPIKDGYIFAGWTGTELNEKIENVVIATGSIGDKEYTANWKQEKYTITYNLNGGIATANPSTYTIESSNIQINNPTKEGYIFTGWTGSNLTGKTEELTITAGSKGNKEYTANWTPTNYTITYSGLTNEEQTLLNNPTTYNVETENFTINNPENRKDSEGDTTEIFVGWKENTSVSTNIILPGTNMENKIYEAVWQQSEPNTYIITYNLNGGTVSTENVTSFTKFTDTFTLNNPVKEGYIFDGWTENNGNTLQTSVQVEKGTRENLNFTANWTPITYTISYNLSGGTATGNPVTYTVEDNDILLNQPTKEGYTFTGWTGTGLQEKTKEVTIQKRSTENKEYTANYDANTYEVVFDKNTGSGSMANQEMTYDISAELKANEFTKTGYTFKEWNTKDNGTGTSYTEGQEIKNLTKNDKVTLYAIWDINSFEVRFMHDGNEYDKQIVKYNEQATEPTAPQVENVEFLGWYLGNSVYDFSSKVTSNIELVTRFYEHPTVNLSLNSTYTQGSSVPLNASYTVDTNCGLKSLVYYYYKNGTRTTITNLSSLPIGNYTIYAELTDNRENTVTSNATTRILQTLYSVAKVGDYVQYNPTSTSYTSTIYDGNSGTINPSATISWRVLSKNSDGSIDIIPANIAGKIYYGNNVQHTSGGANDVDNIVYTEYENSLQLLANSFINSTFASSARAITESDFTTIKNNGLTISNNYAINKKNNTSNSWTGNGEGGANWDYYIYYANAGELKQFKTWYKYAGTGGQSSTAYKMELGVRPIVRLKTKVLEGGGNGSSGSPWTLTQ